MRSGPVLTVLAVVILQAYAATPQRAAVGAMYVDPKSPVVVRRVNVVGPYAVVLTSGGRIEGELVTNAILVERFTFGWQPLDLLNARCRLQSHKLGQAVDASLMRGMPSPEDGESCQGYLRDAGPSSEVEAVRRLMSGPLVPYVIVAGNWAKGSWYGAGGGESLYQKRDGGWRLVESGGGAMGVDYMRKYGVPQADWCKFGIFDATCH